MKEKFLVCAMLILFSVLISSISYADSAGSDDINSYSYQQQSNEDENSTQNSVTELYVSTFGRAPALTGLAYWSDAVDSGNFSIEQVAQSFFDQPETQSKFPEESSNADFINTVYQNTLSRDPAPEGLSYWVNALDSGAMRRDQAIISIINGAKAATGSLEDAEMLARKTEIGLYFANSPVGSQTDDDNFMDWAKDIITHATNSEFTIDKAEDYISWLDDGIYKLSGMNFGPFVEDGQNPDLGSIVSEAHIDELLGVVASYTESVRLFGIDGGLEHVIELAPEYDLDVYPGVWLGKYESTNAVQMDKLIALVETHDFPTVIIGSEVLYRGDLTSSQLLAHINNFKGLFPDVDVTYADTYGVLLDSPEIVEACDVVYANFYPYWEGVGVEEAVANVAYQYQLLEEAYPDKKIVISETGWPTDGAQIGEAVPSIENAVYYLTNLRAWADSAGVDLLFAFEAFDEPWKVANEGEVGANWGIWTSDLELKQGMEDIFDFDIVSNFEDNWSDFLETIEGDPTITITSTSDGYVRGTVSGVAPLDYGVAGFIRVSGKWWTKPTYASKVTPISTSGTWSFDRITGGVDSSADMVAVFLIPYSFDPPTCSGSSSLPQSLYDNAVAYTTASM